MNQGSGAFSGSGRSGGWRSRQGLQNELYDLRLQLWDLRLESLRNSVLDKLPYLIVFLFRHAWRTVFLELP